MVLITVSNESLVPVIGIANLMLSASPFHRYRNLVTQRGSVIVVTQEIVVFRDNIQNRMRKLCLLAPNGERSLCALHGSRQHVCNVDLSWEPGPVGLAASSMFVV